NVNPAAVNTGRPGIASQGRQNSPAVEVWRHDIESNRDWVVLLGLPKPLASARRGDDRKPRLTKAVPDAVGRGLIVVDDQHAFVATKLWHRSANFLLAPHG